MRRGEKRREEGFEGGMERNAKESNGKEGTAEERNRKKDMLKEARGVERRGETQERRGSKGKRGEE